MLLATSYDVLSGFSMAFMVIMVLLSVILTVIVVLQQGTNANLGAIAGGAETFFGKNKAKTLEAKFKKLTVIFAIAILVTSILFFVFQILIARL